MFCLLERKKVGTFDGLWFKVKHEISAKILGALFEVCFRAVFSFFIDRFDGAPKMPMENVRCPNEEELMIPFTIDDTENLQRVLISFFRAHGCLWIKCRAMGCLSKLETVFFSTELRGKNSKTIDFKRMISFAKKQISSFQFLHFIP